MKKIILFTPPWKYLAYTAMAAFVFLLIGTFFDLQISNTLFTKGTLYEAAGYIYGPLPLFWVFIFFGYSTLNVLWPLALWKRIAGLFLVLGIVSASCWYIISHGASYYTEPWLNWVIGLLSCILPPALLLKIIWKQYPALQIWKYSCLSLLAAGSAFLCITVLKYVVLRPRYRAIQEYETLFFKPWYSLQRPDIFPGLDRDQVYSFPSGHTTAASAILLSCLPFHRKGRRIAWIAGLCWIAATALSRMIAGAHFLSDVSFALLVFLGCFTVVFKLYDLFEKRKGSKAPL